MGTPEKKIRRGQRALRVGKTGSPVAACISGLVKARALAGV
jgi:hypothetical protein